MTATGPMTTVAPRLRLKNPMVSVWTAVALIGGDEDTVLGLVEDGQIRYAWNIARTGGRNRCVRIASLSITDYLAGSKRAPAEEEEALWKSLFGASSAVAMSVARLARVFNCSNTHVAGLAKDGLLKQVGEAGPWQTQVCRGSVEGFLLERRIR